MNFIQVKPSIQSSANQLKQAGLKIPIIRPRTNQGASNANSINDAQAQIMQSSKRSFPISDSTKYKLSDLMPEISQTQFSLRCPYVSSCKHQVFQDYQSLEKHIGFHQLLTILNSKKSPQKQSNSIAAENSHLLNFDFKNQGSKISFQNSDPQIQIQHSREAEQNEEMESQLANMNADQIEVEGIEKEIDVSVSPEEVKETDSKSDERSSRTQTNSFGNESKMSEISSDNDSEIMDACIDSNEKNLTQLFPTNAKEQRLNQLSSDDFQKMEDLDAFQIPEKYHLKLKMLQKDGIIYKYNGCRQTKRQIKKQIKHNERILCQNKGRKDKKTCDYLLKVFDKYDGILNEQQLRNLTYITGFKRKQLIKWFYDHKKKISEAVRAKTLSCPNAIFMITNTRTGKNMTPTFNSMVCNKPIFTVEKIQR